MTNTIRLNTSSDGTSGTTIVIRDSSGTENGRFAVDNLGRFFGVDRSEYNEYDFRDLRLTKLQSISPRFRALISQLGIDGTAVELIFDFDYKYTNAEFYQNDFDGSSYVAGNSIGKLIIGINPDYFLDNYVTTLSAFQPTAIPEGFSIIAAPTDYQFVFLDGWTEDWNFRYSGTTVWSDLPEDLRQFIENNPSYYVLENDVLGTYSLLPKYVPVTISSLIYNELAHAYQYTQRANNGDRVIGGGFGAQFGDAGFHTEVFSNVLTSYADQYERGLGIASAPGFGFYNSDGDFFDGHHSNMSADTLRIVFGINPEDDPYMRYLSSGQYESIGFQSWVFSENANLSSIEGVQKWGSFEYSFLDFGGNLNSLALEDPELFMSLYSSIETRTGQNIPRLTDLGFQVVFLAETVFIIDGNGRIVEKFDVRQPPPPSKEEIFQEALNSDFADVGVLFGSILGSVIAGGSGELGDSFKSTLFSNVGAQLGRYIGAALDTEQSDLIYAIGEGVDDVIESFPNTVVSSGISTVSGAISTMLSDEMVRLIGIQGEAGDFVSHVTGSVLDEVITGRLTDVFTEIGWLNAAEESARQGTNAVVQQTVVDEFGNLKFIGWTAAASYLGKRLADEIVEPKNNFSAVSSAVVGGYLAVETFKKGLAFAKLLGGSVNLLGLFAVATVAAFVGVVVARLFGNLFGSDTPPPPQADAETLLSFDTGYYYVGEVNSQNGGDEDLVRNMSEAARDTLNGLIGLITYESEIAGNANYSSPTQTYGHTGDQIWVKLGASTIKHEFDSADEAVDFGALWAIGGTKIVGGGLFLKRAVYRSEANSLLGLSADLQIAEEFAFYLQNNEFINAAIAEPYESLSDEDKTLYDAHQARITRVMAAPRDEFGELVAGQDLSLTNEETGTDGLGDLDWYNANQTQVDSIIDQLAVTQFAAGWIITLQRAAELGLDQTSVSDFYGGMAGFADSLKILARTDFEYEDISFGLNGTTLEVEYGAAHSDSDNLFRGGDLSRGMDIFNAVDRSGGLEAGIERLDDGSRAVVMRDTGYNTGAGSYHLSSFLNVTGAGDAKNGTRFDVSSGQGHVFAFDVKLLAGSEDMRVRARIRYLDANNNQISNANGGYVTASATVSENWQRVEVVGTAPTNAAYAFLQILNEGIESNHANLSTSEIAFRSFQFNRSDMPFDEAPYYSAPVYELWNAEDFFEGADYHEMTGAIGVDSVEGMRAALDAFPVVTGAVFLNGTGPDASSGSDYWTYTGSAGITMDDYSTETWRVTYTPQPAGGGDPIIGDGSNDETVDVTFEFTGGDDIFTGGSGDDHLIGRSGYDWLDGGDGDDILEGGSEDDVLLGRGGSNRLLGGDGNDYLVAGTGNNSSSASVQGQQAGLWGGNGDDILVAGYGNGNLNGQAGDDIFYVYDRAENKLRDLYNGGAGNDTLSFARLNEGITLSFAIQPLSNGWVRFDGLDQYINIENFEGTEFDDEMTGDGGNNTIRGLGGDDILNGNTGSDILEGGRGADELNGGSGRDTASYESSDFAVWIDRTEVEAFGGDAEGDTFINIEDLIGSDFDDTFKGQSDASNENFSGGRGDDWFVATAGSDVYRGDEDFDTIDYSEYTEAVDVSLYDVVQSTNLGEEVGFGALGAAGHTYYGIEHIVGTDYNDTLRGSLGDDVFQAGKGNDTIYGGFGLDTYIYHLGDGQDTIAEALDAGWDTLMFGDGISWSDLKFTGFGSGSNFTIRFEVTGDEAGYVEIVQNWDGDPGDGNRVAKIDALDVGGVGAVDIKHLEGGAPGGTNNADTLSGDIGFNRADIIWGYAGDDVIYAGGNINGSDGGYDTKDNLIIAGRDNDTIYASVGDDTYVFEAGDGADTIYDTGGLDRIQFGPTVAAEDVIYELGENNDLFIGLRDFENPELTASQVTDRIRVMNVSQDHPVIEFITAGGVDIDLRKLDLWATPPSTSGDTGGTGGSGGGGFGNSAPIASTDFATARSSDFGITTVNVLANDTDPDGDTLSVTKINSQTVGLNSSVTLSSGATVYVGENGLLTYINPNTYSSYNDSFTYSIADGNGGTSSAQVTVNNINDGGGGFLFPILIDLDGDGADVVSVSNSRVVFESDSGGPLWRAGWFGSDDGLLALDRDGDGIINKLSEISFVNDLEGASTDLEGLAAFDDNSDGVFDGLDEAWADFRIWRDLNQNGVGTEEELFTLDELGIAGINLTLSAVEESTDGYSDSVLLNSAEIIRADGVSQTAYDLALRAELAHISGIPQGLTPESWTGFTWDADGAFGVAHQASAVPADENETAQLWSIHGSTLNANETLPEQDLVRYVDFDDSMSAPEPTTNPNDPTTPSFGVQPLVIDMDGDGVELINPFFSPIEVDANGDGAYDRMGWISTDDAFLVLDRNGDGSISTPDEISFVQDLPGAQTDLEGLSAYDTNGDGWFDASDARFGEFQVWQDSNFNGVSETGELLSLAQVGIERIGLTSTDVEQAFFYEGDNTIFGEAEILYTDGRVGVLGDVQLTALTGVLEEQLLTEQLRAERQSPFGIWNFGLDSRRDALEQYRSQSDARISPDDFGFNPSGGKALGFGALDRLDSNFAATNFRTDLPVSENDFAVIASNGIEAFNALRDPADQSASNWFDRQNLGEIDDLSSVRRPVSKWWLGILDSIEPNGSRRSSLRQLMDRLDAEKQGAASTGANDTTVPANPKASAEQQRLLQAMAAFRGSSGVDMPKRLTDQRFDEMNVFANSSIRMARSTQLV